MKKNGMVKIERVLGEALMGFLALLAFALALAPAVFPLADSGLWVLEAIQWGIIAIFAVEYGTSLALANDKWRFARDPWRILDLLIIVAPLVSLLPQVGAALRSSPVFRLLRLVRVAVFGARAGGAAARLEAPERALEHPVSSDVFRVEPGSGGAAVATSWNEFLRWLAGGGGGWFHVSGVTPEKLDQLAAQEGISRGLLHSCLSDANYPRLGNSERGLLLSVWVPTGRVSEKQGADRTAVLLLANESSVITLSRRARPLHEELRGFIQSARIADAPFPTRVTHALLKLVLERNEDVAGNLERELRTLENVNVRDTREVFFQQAFRVRKELSAANADLWRTRGLLLALAEGKLSVPGGRAEHHELLRVMADQADYLYETVTNLREGVLSVLELHLNVVSFQMNKFMRLLAAVSVLGLIPGIVGGLLGMNLAGNPWSATLPQVAFGVGMAILLSLYLFVVKGWLR